MFLTLSKLSLNTIEELLRIPCRKFRYTELRYIELSVWVTVSKFRYIVPNFGILYRDSIPNFGTLYRYTILFRVTLYTEKYINDL